MNEALNLKKVIHNISKKTGKGGVYVYYSNKGKVKRFKTGVSIDPEKWNSETGTATHKTLNADEQKKITNVYNTIEKIVNDYHHLYRQLPAVDVVETLLNKPKVSSCVHQLFNEYVDRVTVTNELADKSVKYYKACGKRVKEVADYYNYELTLETLNFGFIQLFIDYSRKVKKLSNTTIKQRLDVLKSFVRDLTKHDIEHNINIEKWNKINKDKVDFLCLEKNEVEAIKEYTPKSPREDRIKDIILFLSHTGMRISDMKHITKANDVNGMLIFEPQKTTRHKIECKVPISKVVREILKKYNYKLPSYTGKYLNPYISDFCGQIKEIKKTGKHIDLTSHSVGRKTFINLCVQANIPIPTICGYTGHNNLDTIMKHYLDKHMNALPQLKNVFEF